VGQEPAQAGLALGKRAPRLAFHRRLGAVAAEPAVVGTVGGDDRHVALLRRAVRLAPHHHREDEGLAALRELGGELEELGTHQGPPRSSRARATSAGTSRSASAAAGRATTAASAWCRL